MNCAYILQNEIHEKYLLNKLTESEKHEYKKHLQKCHPCSESLEKERLLIAGIQATAKQNMKDEIKAQVEQLRSERVKVDWALMYKAAAVLVVLVLLPGVSWYYLHIESPFEAVHKKEILSAEDPVPVVSDIEEEVAEPKEQRAEKIEIKKESAEQRRTKARTTAQKRAKERALMKRSVVKRDVVTPVASAPTSVAKNELDQISGLDLASGKSPLSVKGKQSIKSESLLSEVTESRIIFHYSPAEEKEMMFSKKAVQASLQRNNWRFTSEKGTILINYSFEKADTNYIKYRILNSSENQMELLWMVFYKNRELQPNNLKLELVSNHILQVFRQDTLFYKLDLHKEIDRVYQLKK